MDFKEHIAANIMIIMQHDLDCMELEKLKHAVLDQLDDYDIEPHKELPDAELIDNTDIIKHFLVIKKIAGLSPATLHTYLYHVSRFLNTVNIAVKDVRTNHVRMYLAQLQVGNSNVYVDDTRRILNTFFTFCENEEYCGKNPCRRIDRVKRRQEIEAPYSDTEVELIREACITLREKALVNFLLSTGCRRDEVRQITLADIDLNERAVLIHGKGGKDRMVYFSAKCEIHLREYLESRENVTDADYLFTSSRKPYTGLTNSGLNKIIKTIGIRSGVTNVHLHRFRKWFGTYMANHGVAIQDLKEMMGHSKLETTNTYYTMANLDRIKLSHKTNAA